MRALNFLGEISFKSLGNSGQQRCVFATRFPLSLHNETASGAHHPWLPVIYCYFFIGCPSRTNCFLPPSLTAGHRGVSKLHEDGGGNGRALDDARQPSQPQSLDETLVRNSSIIEKAPVHLPKKYRPSLNDPKYLGVHMTKYGRGSVPLFSQCPINFIIYFRILSLYFFLHCIIRKEITIR